MEPTIRPIQEPQAVPASQAKTRSNRDGRRPFLLEGDAAEIEGDDAAEAESRLRSTAQSVGSRPEGESGSHVDVTA